MSNDHVCPVCLQSADAYTVDFDSGTALVQCPRCGRFRITQRACEDSDHLTSGGQKRYLLSAAVRQQSARGNEVLLRTENIPAFIDGVQPPKTPLEGIDRLMIWLEQKGIGPSDSTKLQSQTDYPVLAARDANQFDYFVQKAKELGFIELFGGGQVRIDLGGWQRLQELRKTGVLSNQAFVAMWFDPSVMDAWRTGIKPALDSTGFCALRVDLVEHDEKIDDFILSQIRRSGLLVADFTGHRPGVYFEAGFAMGLGIYVIRTCRADQVLDLHFDTRQYNHILWSDPAELQAKLRDRIEAVLPGRPDRE